ncbi:MAG TPA: sigma-70 family RNA polymerase sigma factor [Thermoanaerobaculia bacterium]|nr:sigma-70 family RNA polymerase sigma factor [Thermoanaerobaculia bacterium]
MTGNRAPRPALTRSDDSAEHSDRELVEACLAGRQSAWDALLRRYRTLVYSIIVKSGGTTGEEDDVFQAVWLDVYNQLDRLKSRDSLRAWLCTVTRHKCYHWRMRRHRLPEGLDESWASAIPDHAALPPETLEEIERAQDIREAVAALPERCRELVLRLFVDDPPLPYAEIARSLGLAEGSIGALRGRCLERLKHEIELRTGGRSAPQA